MQMRLFSSSDASSVDTNKLDDCSSDLQVPSFSCFHFQILLQRPFCLYQCLQYGKRCLIRFYYPIFQEMFKRSEAEEQNIASLGIDDLGKIILLLLICQEFKYVLHIP